MNKRRLENKIDRLTRKLRKAEGGINYLVIDRRRIKVGFTKQTLRDRMKHYETHNSYFQLIDAQAGTEEAERDWREYLIEMGCSSIPDKTERYEWLEMPDDWDINLIKKNGFSGLLDKVVNYK